MKEYCENPFCESQSVKEVAVSVEKPSDQVRSLCATCEEAFTWGIQHGHMSRQGLKIYPPPEEEGDESLFRVVYIIDVNAGNMREAAEYTHRIMKDPDSQRPVLHVIDSRGNSIDVDLAENDDAPVDSEKTNNYKAANRLKESPRNMSEIRKKPVTDMFTKTTVGFVVQTFRKNSKGWFVCTHQEFIAGDQCDYEDVEGNPIEPPDHEYQPCNMTLKGESPNEKAQAVLLTRAYDAIEEALENLDVGGEQSRQFSEEIRILRDVIDHPRNIEDTSDGI